MHLVATRNPDPHSHLISVLDKETRESCLGKFHAREPQCALSLLAEDDFKPVVREVS